MNQASIDSKSMWKEIKENVDKVKKTLFITIELLIGHNMVGGYQHSEVLLNKNLHCKMCDIFIAKKKPIVYSAIV